MLLIDIGLTNLESVPQEPMSVDDFKIELHLACADPRQIEQVIN